MAEWKDFGEDGIYQCSKCGMAAGWSYPRHAVQMLSEYCSSCGAKMENADTETPREKIKAVWMHRGKEHKYYCSICGQKESAPRIWCPNCGCRMSMNSWEKRWGIKEVTDDVLGAVESAKKRKKRSDSEELISLNYTLEEFIDSNPKLLMAER